MRSDTQTVTIDAAPEAVLRFVADPENLPRSAIGFAKAVRRDHDWWVVQTGQGEVAVAIDVANRAARSTSGWSRPRCEATAYGRVVANAPASSSVPAGPFGAPTYTS